MKGQSLFEVLIALAVSALIIVGIVILATNSIRNTTFSRNNSLANRYAQEGIEWLRGEREKGWTSTTPLGFIEHVKNTSNSKLCLNTLSWAISRACTNAELIVNTIFKREVTFTCYTYIGASPLPTPNVCTGTSVNTVNALVSVSWTDSQGTHTVETDTDLTNWKAQ